MDPKREDEPSEVDRKVSAAANSSADFAHLTASQKAALLFQVTEKLASVSADIVALGCEAKGIERGTPTEAEEWFAGPTIAVGLARHHAESQRQIARKGHCKSSRWTTQQNSNGRTVTALKPLFPGGGIVESGITFHVMHEKGISPAEVRNGHAELVSASKEAGTTAVLGAGNVASIPFGDVIHTLFVEGRTAVLKMNPVNAYLREPFERALAPLIEAGYVQIVSGGAAVGSHLIAHRSITHVHLTGSSETFDHIVWGPPGPEREARKKKGERVVTKPVTAELGNISPIMIMPYLYSGGEIRAMADNIGTQLTNNASFNCNAGKMLVLPRHFPQRSLLISALTKFLETVPTRKAYYPGATERHQTLTHGRQNTIQVGNAKEGQLPWSLVTDLDPNNTKDTLFSTEPFCSMLSIVEVDSLDPSEYLNEAVTFCNERLWGTLSASIFVPPLFEDDNHIEHILNSAIERLNYGAVGINVWPALVYATPRAPWGGSPTATPENVQSGIGFVHNPLFLPKIEKTIVHGPLQPFPRPPFVSGHKHGLATARRLLAYAERPAILTALSVAKTAVFG